MRGRTEYIVEPTGRSEASRIDVCRAVLEATAADVASFQTDIPWSQADDWPPEVRDAAEVLSALRQPRRSESDLYRQTGVQANTDPRVWDAFLLFAPYAFDATAWAARSDRVVDLADCAASIVVRLTAAQAQHVAAAIGREARLVPTDARPASSR